MKMNPTNAVSRDGLMKNLLCTMCAYFRSQVDRGGRHYVFKLFSIKYVKSIHNNHIYVKRLDWFL